MTASGRHIPLYLYLLGLAGACSGGHGAAGGNATTGDLRVEANWPEDGAVQVDRNAAIWVTFDATLTQAAVHDDQLYLVDAADTPVEGTLSTRDQGRTVVFTPGAPLAAACDYTFVVGGEVCDEAGRLLPQSQRFMFRTFDAQAPQVAAASVSQNATGVDRSTPLVVAFDERLDPASITTSSVVLRDSFAASVPLRATLTGASLSTVPIADLIGSRGYTLEIVGGDGGVTDVAGNALAATWRVSFTTAADGTAPLLRFSHPDNGAADRSPALFPGLVFNESMDAASFELGGIELRDEFNNQVAFAMAASPDQRTLRLFPRTVLATQRLYAITLRGGAAGVTDVSGNSLAATTVVSFRTGTDQAAPTVVGASPADGATRVSPNFAAQVVFSEAMDPTAVTNDAVVLRGPTGPVYATLALSADGTMLTVIPAVSARPLVAHTLTVLGGVAGLRDAAGNPLASDVSIRFTTNGDATIPTLRLSPVHGAIAVPRNARLVGLFDPALDPTSVRADTITVVHRGTALPVPGTVTIGRANRALVFTPEGLLPANAALDVTVRGGPTGPRSTGGNWLTQDAVARLQTGSGLDGTPPQLTVTLNGIASQRAVGLSLPPSGFTIEADAFDSGDHTVDLATLELVLSGPTTTTTSDALFAETVFGSGTARILVPARLALAPGSYTLHAWVQDVAGNRSLVRENAFTVTPAHPDVQPFERTQVVWVRFDMDREGGGRGNGDPDFDEDLRDYGLLSARDPLGRNAWLRALVIDGVLAQANRMFSRNPDGGPVPGSSVAIRLLQRQPCHPLHMRIAVGGQDPEGGRKRAYGEASSGVLGRAFFDYRNGSFTENDTSTSPGLGVFCSEMFLYEGRIFRDLYPYYVTMFGRTYRPLSPHMGGTPAGEHALDATVLAPGFVYASAPAAQRLRYDQILQGADDFATVMGTILAHEIGHSLGLTAEGPPPRGLHGDRSLHDDQANPGDVMSAYVSWDSLVAVQQAFRDVDLAYLRQRILCR